MDRSLPGEELPAHTMKSVLGWDQRMARRLAVGASAAALGGIGPASRDRDLEVIERGTMSTLVPWTSSKLSTRMYERPVLGARIRHPYKQHAPRAACAWLQAKAIDHSYIVSCRAQTPGCMPAAHQSRPISRYL